MHIHLHLNRTSVRAVKFFSNTDDILSFQDYEVSPNYHGDTTSQSGVKPKMVDNNCIEVPLARKKIRWETTRLLGQNV